MTCPLSEKVAAPSLNSTVLPAPSQLTTKASSEPWPPKLSSCASGASLRPVTVIETVATSVPPLPSLIV